MATVLSTNPAPHAGPTVSMVDRVFAVLSAFRSAEHLTLAQLNRRTGIPKGSLHRLLRQLCDQDVLERDGDAYHFGVRLFQLWSGMGDSGIRVGAAMPALRDLRERTGATVHLAVLSEGQVVYLSKVCSHEVTLPTERGMRLPAHCSALGKALLAFAPPPALKRAFAARMARRTPFTINAPQDLALALRSVRRHGFATDLQEGQLGVACIAVPVLDQRGRGVAAVSVSVKAARIPRNITRGDTLTCAVIDAAQTLSRTALSEFFHSGP